MSRPVNTDLDCRGVSRVRNLPAPLAAGDAVNRSTLAAAIAQRGLPVGGSAGQVLARASDVDYDCSWVPRTPYRLTWYAGPAVTWTNMPGVAAFFLGSPAFIQAVDLSGFRQGRLLVNRLGGVGVNNSRLVLRWRADYSQTAGSYQELSSPAIACVMNTAVNTYLDSGWQELLPEVRGEGMLALLGQNGNGQADPQFGAVVAEFR